MSFARALATVSGLTGLSRIAGFVRDALTAVFLGAGAGADAFFVAQRLPNLFRSLFAEGAFAAAFVPLYADEKERAGTQAARNFANEALALLIAFLTPLTILFILGMPWLIRLIAPGFSEDGVRYDLAVQYSRITFPYLLLISITALQTGVLNAHDRFAPGAAAPILLNIIMIAGLLLSDFFHLAVGETQAWAMAIAGGVQAAWLALCCRRAKLGLSFFKRPRLTATTRRLFKNIGPGALGAGAAQINLLVSTLLASLLPTGAVSYLYYADRLNQLPLGVVGIAVATTLLPVLSVHETRGEADKIRHYLSRGIEFCLLLGLPSAIGLALAAQPIIGTLFEHGAFTREDTIQTARTLSAYAIGIPAFLLVKVFAARFFAQKDTRTPVRVALIAVAINILVSLALIQPLAHVGMALAVSLATGANALLLYILLRKKGEVLLDEKARKRLPRLLIAAAAMAVLTYVLSSLFSSHLAAEPLWTRVLALMGLIGVSASFYAGLCVLFGALPVKEAITFLKRGA